MRILLSADPELPVPPRLYGGIERIVAMLAEELRERGHVVGLVANRHSSAEVASFYAWPGAKSQNVCDTIRNTYRLMTAAADFRPDVVHSFSRALYLCPLFAGKVPVVMSYQRKPGSRQVRYAATLGGDSLLFTGCSEYISTVGRSAGGQWRTVHNFVDLSKYRLNPVVAADAPLIFLSRIERIKGAHTAIAAAKLAGRRLILAGNHGTSGEDLRYWSEEIVPHLEPGAVDYVGAVDDVQKDALLGQAAGMIVPIEWDEPFGIVFAEALACGTPVISGRRGAVPEIVRDGVEGFLVDGIGGCVDAIRSLQGIDRRACRQRAENNFSAGVAVAEYLRLYDMMCNGS